MSSVAPPRAPGGLDPIMREIARGGLAGLLAGFIVGGIGGRVAMRVSALLDPAARGARTEGGAIVGEFTLGGTVGFVIFVGLFAGIALAVTWVVTQRWMPLLGVARYATAALVVVALGARFAIEGRNIDFLILDPKAAQVAIFVVLAGAAGALVVGIDRWLEHRLPPASSSALYWYRSIAAVGALLAIPVTFGLFSPDTCSCASPPRLPGALLIGLGAVSVWAWSLQRNRTPTPPWLRLLGRSLLAATAAAGLLHLAGEVAHFT